MKWIDLKTKRKQNIRIIYIFISIRREREKKTVHFHCARCLCRVFSSLSFSRIHFTLSFPLSLNLSDSICRCLSLSLSHSHAHSALLAFNKRKKKHIGAHSKLIWLDAIAVRSLTVLYFGGYLRTCSMLCSVSAGRIIIILIHNINNNIIKIHGDNDNRNISSLWPELTMALR